MRVLVTGSNGLLGQKLVKALKDDSSVQLIATGRGECRLPESWKVPYTSLDVTDEEEVCKVIYDHRPDVVIHTAAMTHVDECENNKEVCKKLNVDAVAYLVTACNQNEVFLLHVSTDFIFNGQKGPLTEEDKPDPVNYYGETKWWAEQYIMEHSKNWSIARTVLVYGITENMSRSNIILWVKNSLEQEKEIRVVDDQYRTPTLAEDLAAGCILIAKGRYTGVFNISGSDFITPYDIAIETAEYFGLNKDLISRTDSNTFKQPAARPLKTGFVIEKARKVLGYEPHTFREGLEKVALQIKA